LATRTHAPNILRRLVNGKTAKRFTVARTAAAWFYSMYDRR
jgi:hypothetical protein